LRNAKDRQPASAFEILNIEKTIILLEFSRLKVYSLYGLSLRNSNKFQKWAATARTIESRWMGFIPRPLGRNLIKIVLLSFLKSVEYLVGSASEVVY
jgi:hypothetical protein